MIHYQRCPVCNSDKTYYIFSPKDYTVSGNDFPVYECMECTARFTQDVPDAEHIGPYYKSDEYISHTETKKGLVNSIYHQVRKITLKQKMNLVRKKTGIDKGSLLDIGCGTGAFLSVLQEHGWAVLGLEPDEGARKIALEKGVKVMPSDALFEIKDTFNAITMWHVLEHVHDLHGYINRIAQLMADNGVLFVAVPNYTSGDARTYGQFWAAYDVPRHLYHFSPASMNKLMNDHGMKVRAIEPMWFDSVYVSMLSEKYKNGKMSMLSAVWHGLGSNMKAVKQKDKCSSLIYVIEKAGP